MRVIAVNAPDIYRLRTPSQIVNEFDTHGPFRAAGIFNPRQKIEFPKTSLHLLQLSVRPLMPGHPFPNHIRRESEVGNFHKIGNQDRFIFKRLAQAQHQHGILIGFVCLAQSHFGSGA